MSGKTEHDIIERLRVERDDYGRMTLFGSEADAIIRYVEALENEVELLRMFDVERDSKELFAKRDAVGAITSAAQKETRGVVFEWPYCVDRY